MQLLKVNRVSSWGVVLAALFALAGGCGHPELRPAPAYKSAIGRRTLAVESRGGLTVTADGSVWDGSPTNLDTKVTPVWVTLHNKTGQPLRIQYDEFVLRGARGGSYAALTPYALRAVDSGPRYEVSNGGYFERFSIAPYLAPHYPWLPVWGSPLPSGLDGHSVTDRAILPTTSMIERALPEGVLGDGGTASGYLYFQRVDPHGNVTFVAQLEGPPRWQQPGPRVAAIEISFHRVAHPWRRKRSAYSAPRAPDWDPPP